MKKPNIRMPDAVSRKAAMAVLKIRKNSPTILFGVGIAAGVGTVVTASLATLKVEGVIDGIQQDLADIERWRDLDSDSKAKLSENDLAKARRYVYLRGTGQLTKLYAPAVLLGATSVVCLTQSHRILASRNASLAAAYTAVDKAFAEYRKRVRDELGDEKDREFRYGVEEREFEATQKGTGNKTKIKERRAGDGRHSMYAKVFGPQNRNWNANPEYNVAFLRIQQAYATDRLRSRGYLFLNDVYELLGMEHTKAGQQVGWLYNKKSPLPSDGYVDFKIWDEKQVDKTIEFMNGWENELVLDFNVDGPILDLI